MQSRNDLAIFTPDDLHEPNRLDMIPTHAAWMSEAVCWVESFLMTSNPKLGRSGAVCPYAKAAVDSGHFYLACVERPGASDSDLVAVFNAFGDWFDELQRATSSNTRQLLALAVVLPDIDQTDTARLLRIHRQLKDRFVADGLMIGQFHPRCDESGLWSDDFRPLRSPMPMLAIRHMIASDLPFLLTNPAHTAAYFERFGPDLPAHVQQFVDARR